MRVGCRVKGVRRRVYLPLLLLLLLQRDVQRRFLKLRVRLGVGRVEGDLVWGSGFGVWGVEFRVGSS